MRPAAYERSSILMFCRFCGKPLADGEDCTCSDAVAARAAAAGHGEPAGPKPASGPENDASAASHSPEEPEQNSTPAGQPPVLNLVSIPRRPSRARVFFRNAWQCFRSYFIRPVPTLATSARIKDWQTGLFWAGVQAVLAGLCAMALVGGISMSVSSAYRSALASSSVYNSSMVPSLGPMMLIYLLRQLHIHYLTLFLILLVASLLGTLGLSAAGYGLSAALHRRKPFLSLLAAVGVGSIPSACLTALAAIFCLFWPAAGIFLLIAAGISLVVNSYTAIKTACETDDPRLILYYGLGMAVVVTVVLLIVAHFLPSVILLGSGQSIID